MGGFAGNGKKANAPKDKINAGGNRKEPVPPLNESKVMSDDDRSKPRVKASKIIGNG